MPAFVVIDTGERALDRVAHIGDIIVAEGEAVAVVVSAVEYAVLQAADLADDRDGTVAQGDHLRQTAGLLLTGHQEDIRAGVDLARQFGNKSVAGDDSAGIEPLHIAEEVLVLFITGAEDDKLHVIVVQQIGQTAADEVETLVGDHTGDHGDDRDRPVLLEP